MSLLLLFGSAGGGGGGTTVNATSQALVITPRTATVTQARTIAVTRQQLVITTRTVSITSPAGTTLAVSRQTLTITTRTVTVTGTAAGASFVVSLRHSSSPRVIRQSESTYDPRRSYSPVRTRLSES